MNPKLKTLLALLVALFASLGIFLKLDLQSNVTLTDSIISALVVLVTIAGLSGTIYFFIKSWRK